MHTDEPSSLNISPLPIVWWKDVSPDGSNFALEIFDVTSCFCILDVIHILGRLKPFLKVRSFFVIFKCIGICVDLERMRQNFQVLSLQIRFDDLIEIKFPWVLNILQHVEAKATLLL